MERAPFVSVLRRFSLHALASGVAAFALLWPMRSWLPKSGALLAAGLFCVLAELPVPRVRGTVLRGGMAFFAVLLLAVVHALLAAVAILLGAPFDRIAPGGLVAFLMLLSGHVVERGLASRQVAAEMLVVVLAVVAAVGAEELRHVGETARSRSTVSEGEGDGEALLAAADGGALPAMDAFAEAPPYGEPNANLPPAFSGGSGDGEASPSGVGGCPDELSEDNTALAWLRLSERRGEGSLLLDPESNRPAPVVPRRMFCSCTPHRERSNLFLAFCGRTEELCRAEAEGRAEPSACRSVPVGVARRVECSLQGRGVSVRGDDTSVSVGLGSLLAANKLIPAWATLDARLLAQGRVVPLRVQRLRWSRGTTAPVEWRASNLSNAGRIVGVLGRSLTRAGVRCSRGTCESGQGSLEVNWCEATNKVHAPEREPPEPAKAARSTPSSPAKSTRSEPGRAAQPSKSPASGRR